MDGLAVKRSKSNDPTAEMDFVVISRIRETLERDTVDLEVDTLTVGYIADLLLHIKGRQRQNNASIRVSSTLRVLCSMLQAFAPDVIPEDLDVVALLAVMRDDARFEPLAQEATDKTMTTLMNDDPQQNCKPTAKKPTQQPVATGASLSIDATLPDITNVLEAVGTPLLLVPLLGTLGLWLYKITRRLRNGDSIWGAISGVGWQEIGSILLAVAITMVSMQIASNMPWNESFFVALQQSIPPGLGLQDLKDRLEQPTSSRILEVYDDMDKYPIHYTYWNPENDDYTARSIRYEIAKLSKLNGVLGWDMFMLFRDGKDLFCGTEAADTQFAALDAWITAVMGARTYYRKLRYAKWGLSALFPLFNLLFTNKARSFMDNLWGHDAESVQKMQEKLEGSLLQLQNIPTHDNGVRAGPNGLRARQDKIATTADIIMNRASGMYANHRLLVESMATLITLRTAIHNAPNVPPDNLTHALQAAALNGKIDQLFDLVNKLPKPVLPSPSATGSALHGLDTDSSVVNALFAKHLRV